MTQFFFFFFNMLLCSCHLSLQCIFGAILGLSDILNIYDIFNGYASNIMILMHVLFYFILFVFYFEMETCSVKCIVMID